MTNPAALRVLSIAHTAVSRAAGRLRYHPLAQNASLVVRLIVPARWHEFGRWIDADAPDDPGIAVTPLPIRMPRTGPARWYMHFYPGLAAAVRRFRPDVIHLWEEPWSLVALQGAILAWWRNAALVMEVDQNLLKRLPPPFELIRRFVLRRTDLVLSRSNDATEVVRACGYAGPVLPIRYGVDDKVFRPGPASTSNATLRLGFVGRLVVEKGLDDVFDALLRTRSPVTLSILGEGPHEPALRARAAAIGLADRVRFLPWTAPQGVAAFLRDLDVLVLPTRTTGAVKEQFGRVIIEAQACGTPVIGSMSGAIPETLGTGGWLIPERDPAAMAALLDRLAAAPEEVAACSSHGLANVAARFTYQAVAADLERGWEAAHASFIGRQRRSRRSLRSKRASAEARHP